MEMPVYLSINIDILGVAILPATGPPEAGGWSIRELIRILSGVEGSNVFCVDIVEFAPAYNGADNLRPLRLHRSSMRLRRVW